MQNLKKNLPKDSIIRASVIILIATAIFNATNFFYHMISARMLGPAEYSIVASLFSIVYLLAIFSTTIQNSITKFAAEFRSERQEGKILFLFKRGLRRLLIISSIILATYLVISPLIANFLKIPLLPVLILGPFIILSIILPVNRGILQGMQKFWPLSWNLMMEGALKLGLAALFIYLGLKSSGAIAAVSIAAGAAFFISFKDLKFGKNEKIKKFDTKDIYKFSFITMIALFLIIAMYNVDIFLVKHFLSAEQAGHYAAISLLGKIVFVSATAIGLVMFPKISEMKKKRKDHSKVLKKSLIFALAISLIITLAYFIFSKQIVNIVFGNAYSDIAGLIGLFGVFMTLLSLSYIFILNNLALGKKKFVLFIAAILVMEIVSIMIFHNSLAKIIYSLIILAAALLVLMLLK